MAKRASLKALNPSLVKSQPLSSLIKTNRQVARVVSVCKCAYWCADCQPKRRELPFRATITTRNIIRPFLKIKESGGTSLSFSFQKW